MARFRSTILMVCFISVLMLRTEARASVIAVGENAFPASATVVDFTGVAELTEVNGLTVSGVQFAYTVGGVPLNGAVEIDDGPGITNHISPPNIVSIGDNTGILTVTLPHSATLFGYGYAVLFQGAATNATTVSVFNGTTSLGSLSFDSTPDPDFTGGFAGLLSTSAFDRLEITFNPNVGPAFALDNLMFASSTSSVPEPTAALMIGLGLGVLAVRVRRPS